jgi:hypothetical protein
LLSKITFGSFLVYAPRGTSELSNKAKQFVRALKEERLKSDLSSRAAGAGSREATERRRTAKELKMRGPG